MKKILFITLISFFICNFSFAASNNACGIEKLKQGNACNTEGKAHKNKEKKESFINDLENMMKEAEKTKK